MSIGRAGGQFVTFSLDKQVFAVNVDVVREILDHEDLLPIPQSPDFLLGLRDVRGSGVPVIDLRLKLGMTKTEYTPNTRILVLDIPVDNTLRAIGLVADRVFEVVSYSSDVIEDTPDVGVEWPSAYVTGVVRSDEGFTLIANLACLFVDQQSQTLLDEKTGALSL